MVVIDFDGNLVEGTAPPPAEYPIHTEIYRSRPDVHAVVHTHQPSGTILGIIGAELQPVLHIPSILTYRGEIATWPCPLLVTDGHLGEELVAALGNRNLCHLQGHGVVSVAADLPTAVIAAIALEQLADANLRILQTGRPARVITAAELDSLERHAGPIAGRWAYYEQLADNA